MLPLIVVAKSSPLLEMSFVVEFARPAVAIRVHDTPSVEVKHSVKFAIEYQALLWRATSTCMRVLGSERFVHVRPSGDVTSRPLSPAAINKPSANFTARSVFVTGDVAGVHAVPSAE